MNRQKPLDVSFYFPSIFILVNFISYKIKICIYIYIFFKKYHKILKYYKFYLTKKLIKYNI